MLEITASIFACMIVRCTEFYSVDDLLTHYLEDMEQETAHFLSYKATTQHQA